MEKITNSEEEAEMEETVLIPEDEERLRSLLDDMDNLFGPERQAAAERLKQEGSRATEYILREIDNNPDGNPSWLYNMVCCLKHCASHDSAHHITSLLLDDRILHDHDRSTKSKLLEILENIGGTSQLETLKQYAESISASSNFYADWDTRDTCRTIAHISLHAADQEKIQVAAAWDHIQNIRESSGLERLDLYEMADSIRSREEREVRLAEARAQPSIGWRQSDWDHESWNDEFAEDDPAFDDGAEDSLRDEVIGERKFLNGVERLAIVKRLRERVQENKETSNTGEEPEEPDDFLQKHFLEYRETNPSLLGITMGIEIEIPRKSVLPPEAKQWTETEKSIFLDKRKKDFYETESLGVPPGYDLFYEFAHRPANYPLTIAREVQALMHMGLIDAKYARYPLHVTLGHLERDPQSFVLLRALEATGWSTNKDRLLRPYRTKHGSWTQKGESGVHVRDRQYDNIEGGIQSAIELRTLQLQGITGLDRMLHSAYYLGSALSAFQEQEQGRVGDEKKQALAKLWEEFSSEIKDIFRERDLDPPSLEWGLDHHHKSRPSPFTPFAEMLDKGVSDAKEKVESPEASFVRDIRALIIKTRAEAKKILNEARHEYENKESE